MDNKLINRVANSSLQTIDLQEYYPVTAINVFDISQFLFQGLLLKEKDFRSHVKTWDWSQYSDSVLCISNTNEAIVPKWAYMLIAAACKSVELELWVGSSKEFLKTHYQIAVQKLDLEPYRDGRVVIKGCSDVEVNAQAYAALTLRLSTFAQSIMYGEPCSTVPIFKRPRKVD